MGRKAGFLILLCVLFLSVGRLQASPHTQTPESASPSKIIYVDDDATGFNNGSSWTDAYNYLQDAFAAADVSIKPVEIRVAQGIYKPDQGAGITPCNRNATFRLINDVVLKGGYAGFNETDPNVRDIELYETILSGDLNNNDVAVSDPCDLLNERTLLDNCRCVMVGSGTDETAVLDGFIVTGGRTTIISRGGAPPGGAGMHISSGSPTIINCTFTGNATSFMGGGMYNLNSNPTLINCIFTGNYASNGAGMCNYPSGESQQGSNPILIDCAFGNNYARGNGSGMYNLRSNPRLDNCTFIRNSTYTSTEFNLTYGGGIYNSRSNPKITDCTFSENSAGSGGGIFIENECSLTLDRCTFRSNLAELAGGGVCNKDANDLTLTDCIFSDNVAKQVGGGIFIRPSNTTLTNCVFIRNQAHEWFVTGPPYKLPGMGGGMYVFGEASIINCTFRDNSATEGGGTYNAGEPTFVGCSFIGNSADDYGGGMCNYDSGPELTITNCVFYENSAKQGGGIFNTWGSYFRMFNCTFASNLASNGNALANDPNRPSLTGFMRLTNCILWDGNNTIFDPYPDYSAFAITYSNVQGGWPGEGNIDVEPVFADPENGDYHLKSQAGRWNPKNESWVIDDVTSPCIDAGEPNSSVAFEPYANGGIINMGAYGGTEQASKSLELNFMSLPYVGFIFSSDVEAAESFKHLLEAYGCSVDLIGLDELAQSALVDYDLLIVGNDTGRLRRWGDIQSVAMIESAGNPIIGLGEGGYAFFGKLELSIGYPRGWHGGDNSIYVVPFRALGNMPYPICLPIDGVLRLYAETTHVGIYLPSVPEGVITIGREVDNRSHYPFVLEDNRYFLWGFSGSPDNMTENGKIIFINTVILTANVAWDIESREQHTSQEVFEWSGYCGGDKRR